MMGCLTGHDWETITSSTANEICMRYLKHDEDKLKKFIKIMNQLGINMEEKPVIYNFVNVPFYIEYKNRVCIKCKKIEKSYDNFVKSLDINFAIFLDKVKKGEPIKSQLVLKRDKEHSKRLEEAIKLFYSEKV